MVSERSDVNKMRAMRSVCGVSLKDRGKNSNVTEPYGLKDNGTERAKQKRYANIVPRGNLVSVASMISPRKPALRINLHTHGSGEQVSCGVVGKMMDSVFRRSRLLYSAELHMWRSEYSYDGCINLAAIYR
ncbi:hypothetical protein EVAR_87292_1 [Eumeta japonica]|uniref:Uncharacterized protein n=1 Tax=Eumeta variegata TaxID=151549 RepID=A0A4C1VVY7_EUMVA|nr:hypothetical protein EVAR_87292_1 [Eumeta japonica]